MAVGGEVPPFPSTSTGPLPPGGGGLGRGGTAVGSGEGGTTVGSGAGDLRQVQETGNRRLWQETAAPSPHAALAISALVFSNANAIQGIRAATSAVSTVAPHQMRRPGGASR